MTLQALTPIYADFMVPQQALAQIKVGQEVSARTDTYPGKTFIGKVTAINPRVETATRNVQVRAEIENADRLLVPGMYVTVDTKIGQPQKLITLPQTAIMYNPYGNIVYVVDEKKSGDGAPQLSVHQTFVTLGATRGDQVSVLKGVEEGQTIVTSGQMKLRNGIPIAVNNTVEPRNDPNPKPVDE